MKKVFLVFLLFLSDIGFADSVDECPSRCARSPNAWECIRNCEPSHDLTCSFENTTCPNGYYCKLHWGKGPFQCLPIEDCPNPWQGCE